jgi:hypothetical protein
VSSPQQVFCSFEETAVFDSLPLARQCKSRITGADGAIFESTHFEPGRPPDIARRPFHRNQTGALATSPLSSG